MDKHPENTESTPQDDQVLFPELTQEQIDRIVNRQLKKLDKEYDDCINARDLNVEIQAQNNDKVENTEVKNDEVQDQEAEEEEEEGETNGETGYECFGAYAQIDSDGEGTEEKEPIKEGSSKKDDKGTVFPENSGYKPQIKPIPQDKAEEMQKFISSINIKAPSWAQNLSDEQFSGWVSKMVPK